MAFADRPHMNTPIAMPVAHRKKMSLLIEICLMIRDNMRRIRQSPISGKTAEHSTTVSELKLNTLN